MAAIKQRLTKETQIQEIYYSDFLNNFNIHPNRKDVVKAVNDEAVRRSIRNIILTNRGERVMDPLFGSDVRSILFENMDPATEELLKQYIIAAINNYEPRAKLLGVTVSAMYDMNAYAVTIVFSTINSREPITIELLMNRVR